MTYQIKLRRDEAANWTATNPILAAGEPGYETDTTKLKVGNGVDAWNDLPYQAPANVDPGYGIVRVGTVFSVNNTEIQAQANIAIDDKVTKTFIDGLAVNYNSLSNTPTNVSVFNNDAGYLVSANLTSLTANVNSVNSLTGTVVLTTDNIAQGNTNLYYSNAQVNAFIQSDITTTDIDEGANLYYTNARVIAHIATVPLSVGGNLTVNGNLEVLGNIDYVNVQDLQVVDNQIILNYGNATAREAFVLVDRSGSALNNAHVKWNEIDDRWEIYDGSNTYIVPRSTTDLTEGANLYYSNARVNAFIQSDITTTDIDEGANLYYTTDRANTAIGAYQGSINTAGDITANEIYADLVAPNSGALNIGTGPSTVGFGGDVVDIASNTFTINSGLTTFTNDVRFDAIANISIVETDTILTPDGVSYIYFPGTNSPSDIVILNGDGGAIKLSNADNIGVTIHSNASVDSAGNITAPYFIGNGSALTGFVSKTANVDSVNGATGVVVLDTDDIAEGNANLYFSNARVNAFIQSDITTSDIDEGSNLYYTTGRANTAIAAYQGDINTAGNITAAKFTGNAVTLFGALAGNVVFNPTNLFESSIVNVQAALDDLQINKLNVSSLTSSVTFFSTTANSNVAGYTKLVTTTADPDYDDVAVDVPTGVITGSNQLLANLVSDQNVLTGNTTPINITTIGNIRKTAGGSGQNARFYFEVYKRTAANVETLIGTSDLTPEITSAAYEEFSDIALITDTNFTANDSVVLKFYGTNVGGGSPNYDFQFGGTNPIRTLFPVPVSVIPVDNTADSIEVDTSGFSGILDGNDDTAQKAFNTIDALTTTELPEGTNLYFSNTRVNAFIQDSITTTDIDEGANLYYSNARVNAFIQSDITTTDIDEGANLYFTTDRANTAMDAYLTSITANVDSVNGATGVVVLDTDDIAEGSANLYFSNARVNAFIQSDITTTDIDEGANLYYTDTRANTAIAAYQGNIDTPGNIEAAFFIGNGSTLTGFVSKTANVDSVNGATGVVVLDTDDIAEGNANLYFTTGRANTAIDNYIVTAVEQANVELKQFAETVVDLGNVSGDISSNIDLDLGTVFTMVATGDITINSMANASPGVSATLIVAQDATGSRLLTSNLLYAGNVRTLSTAANTIDIISIINAGNVYYASLTKGYE